jgi:hypothetical protein
MRAMLKHLLFWRRSSFDRRGAPQSEQPEDDIAYRLSGWPELPDPYRTAAVYSVLSVMSVRAVNRGWIAWKTRLEEEHLERLLQHLRHQQVLQTQAEGSRCARLNSHDC